MDLYVPDEYLTGRTLGITRDDVWVPVIDSGPNFWANLDPYPWAQDLLEFVSKVARDVTILTKPLVLEGGMYNFRETGACVQGKLEFLHKHFGGAHGVVFTDKKSVASKPGVLLVDDDESYEAAFTAAGGHQFIWPQPYNRYKPYIGKEMETFVDWYKRKAGQ